jgi:hypothetical protein
MLTPPAQSRGEQRRVRRTDPAKSGLIRGGGRGPGTQLAKGVQRRLQGGDVAAELSDGRVVGATAPGPRVGRGLPIPTELPRRLA